MQLCLAMLTESKSLTSSANPDEPRGVDTLLERFNKFSSKYTNVEIIYKHTQFYRSDASHYELDCVKAYVHRDGENGNNTAMLVKQYIPNAEVLIVRDRRMPTNKDRCICNDCSIF